MAHGATREEAARQIQLALEGALEVAAEQGIKPPAPVLAHASCLTLSMLAHRKPLMIDALCAPIIDVERVQLRVVAGGVNSSRPPRARDPMQSHLSAPLRSLLRQQQPPRIAEKS
jgi:hypothetical protein